MPQTTAIRPATRSVSVPRLQSGAAIAVESSPSGKLNLGFDPGSATTSRPEGSNDLVFELDGGGKVTINGFFAVGDNSLPSLVLPDGTEVASADFFAGSDLDMATAAGPGAGSGATGGGAGDYADDAGSLMGGIDRMGSLGTDFWGGAAEAAEYLAGGG